MPENGRGMLTLWTGFRRRARAVVDLSKFPISLVRRAKLRLRFRRRLLLSTRENEGSRRLGPESYSGLDRCDVRFINLAERRDRREAVESEFLRIGVKNPERFEAVAEAKGILGCAKSHVHVTSKPVAPGRLLMVCEDDLEFLGPRGVIDACIEEFARSPQLDVLCLAYNLNHSAHKVSSRLSISDDVQTTSCYVLKESARELVRSEFKKSVRKISAGRSVRRFALDQQWKTTQRRQLIFAVTNQRLAKQRPSFSDIEERFVDYGR